MKQIHTFLSFILSMVLLHACQSQKSIADSNRTITNWQGSYSGIMPCADCEGIATTVVLNPDMTYSMRTQYLGKSETLHNQEGTFTWNKEGSTITLEGIKGGPRYFKVGGNKLVQLDMEGQPITGNNSGLFILAKTNKDITNKYWKLVEIGGQPVQPNEQQRKEPHMILQVAENRVVGNGGCNGFSGTYQLDSATNRLRFSPLAATKMACMGSMDVESQLFKALEMTDSYHTSGDSLQLFKARMSPLAKFVAVYLK